MCGGRVKNPAANNQERNSKIMEKEAKIYVASFGDPIKSNRIRNTAV